jgi:hypothetical protein
MMSALMQSAGVREWQLWYNAVVRILKATLLARGGAEITGIALMQMTVLVDPSSSLKVPWFAPESLNDSTCGSDMVESKVGRVDLNHVCRAFNKHMGVYVRCQVHQLHFPPQEHVSGIYDVCALYMYLYS